MRPRDMSFRGEESLPGWAAALIRQLPDGGAQAPAGVLSPVTMLNELLTTGYGVIAGRRPPYSDDRESLKIDVQRSLESLGPSSAAVHRVVIADFRKQIGRLSSLLEDAAGANALRASSTVLLGELTTADSRSAALADAVEAFRTDEFVGVCETRLRYLRTVLEAAGHDWSERSRRIANAMSAQTRMTGPYWVTPTLNELPLNKRLQEADDVVREEHPPRGEAHVWLAYADASVPRLYVRKGPIEFYDSRIWTAARTGKWPGRPPEWTQPPELREPGADVFLNGLPDEGFVVVRVSLSDVPIAEARAIGANLARAAVELTGWDTGWAKLEGEVAYASSWFGSVRFADPQELRRRRGRPWVDPIGEALPQLDEALLAGIAAGDAVITELLTDMRWRRSVAAIPDPEHRIALLVTLIERLLVPSSGSSETWLGACGRYLGFTVSLGAIHGQVWDAGYYGVQMASRHAADTQIPAQELVKLSHAGGVTVDLKQVLGQGASLMTNIERGSMESRMLAEVDRRTSDPESALQWLDSEHESFKRTLARAKRHRNAIAHGARPTSDAFASVEPFLDEIARRLIGAVHHCAITNADLIVHLEQARLAALKLRAALSAGGAPELLVTDGG